MTSVMSSPFALCKKMNDIDFTPVIRTLTTDMGFSVADAHDKIKAFSQWFSLIPSLPAGAVYTMLKVPVDDVFHACVWNTAFYRNLCFELFGEFVDHSPIDKETAAQLDEGVKFTVELLERTYGKNLHPDLQQWRKLLDEGNYVVSCMQCPDAKMTDTIVGRTSNGARIVH